MQKDLTVLPMHTPLVNESPQERFSDLRKELCRIRIKQGIMNRLTFHVKEGNVTPKMTKELEFTIYDQFYKEQMHKQKGNVEFSDEVFLQLQDLVDVMVNRRKH